MPESKKISQVEKDKRIRIVMEWILEDWPSDDIITNIVSKWGVTRRHAFRYLSEARKAWLKEEDALIEQKKRLKIESLKKLKRSLKEQYRGTPHGIQTILAVEKEIIKLEGIAQPLKVQLGGDPENPAPVPVEVKHDMSKLTDEELKQLIDISKKAVKA